MSIVLWVFLALAVQGPAAAGDAGTMVWEGTVAAATPLAGGNGLAIVLAPAADNTGPHVPHEIRVTFPDIPSTYRPLINQTPRYLLSEPLQGRVARIHAHVDDRGTHVVAIETRGPDEAAPFRLDYLAVYFDRTADSRVVHESSLAAAVLSRHSEEITRGTSIWLRDVIRKPLFFYDRSEHAKDMIRRFGNAAMVNDIASVQRVLAENGDRTGLIRLRPFVPKDPGDRFVGWWGGFPLEIYRDAESAPTLRFVSRTRRNQEP